MRSKSSYIFMAAAAAAAGCQPIAYENCVDQQFIHEYGVSIDADRWQECNRNGKVITRLRDGVVLSQTFAHGLLNGESTYTYPNSEQIEKKEMFHDDVLISEIHYTPCGVPLFSRNYSSPEAWRETHWYESGHPRSIEDYARDLLVTGEYYTIHSQKDSWVHNGIGERVSRDAWGNFVSLDTFQGGEQISKLTRHPNGSTFEIIPISKGKVHGQRKTYYPGGEPMAIETWVEGQKNGVTIIFQNGEKFAEVPYLAGKKNGIEKRFRDGCVVTQEITWFDGRMHGPTFTYVGDSVQTDWFYKGRLTTRTNFESFGIPQKKH